ncbi:MAG: dienelactone hydrolase family protein [Dysgonamonadaceae bacterium]|nr:dienelactone hydrolase family protein [Dysgonamonadaceae bacterium]
MKKILLIAFCLIPLASYSQTLTACRDSLKGGYNFWFYEPAGIDSTTAKKPLVIFLHGKSLCGRDLSRVLRYGTIDALKKGRPIDAFVLAPQNPGGSWRPAKINDLLEWVKARYDIDTTRVYVLGMSMGGSGTINFVGTYPEKVAAAMALCGSGALSSYCGLTTVPLWIIHGTADKAVPISQSHKVVNAMKNCGDTSLLRTDWLKGVNHSRLARFFYWENTYDWLFAHSLSDTVRAVNQDFSISPATLNEAYRNLDRTTNNIKVIDSQTPVYKKKSNTTKKQAIK